MVATSLTIGVQRQSEPAVRRQVRRRSRRHQSSPDVPNAIANAPGRTGDRIQLPTALEHLRTLLHRNGTNLIRASHTSRRKIYRPHPGFSARSPLQNA
jgi:hypothetical protein